MVRVGVGVAGLAAALAAGAPAAAAGGGHGGGSKGGQRSSQATVVKISSHGIPARAQRSCPRWFGKIDMRGRDRWAFSLSAGRHGASAVLVTMTAFFDTNRDGRADRLVRIDGGSADNDEIIRNRRGGGAAWVVTNSGWKLVSAEALVRGRGAGRLVLSEACAGPRLHKHQPGKQAHNPKQRAHEPRKRQPKRVQRPAERQTKVPVVVVVEEKPQLPVTGPGLGLGGLMGGGAGLIGAGGIALFAARWRRRPSMADVADDGAETKPADGGAESGQA